MKAAATTLSEADVAKQIISFLETRGWRAVRINRTIARGVTYGEKGASDYIFTHPKFPAMYIETKKPGERIRDNAVALALAKPKDKNIKREAEQWTFLSDRRREGYDADWFDSFSDGPKPFRAWYEVR